MRTTKKQILNAFANLANAMEWPTDGQYNTVGRVYLTEYMGSWNIEMVVTDSGGTTVLHNLGGRKQAFETMCEMRNAVSAYKEAHAS